MLIVLMALVMGCGSRKPVSFDFNTLNTYDATFDETWEAAISIFAGSNIPIKTLEKDSGIIVSDPLGASASFYRCKTGFLETIRNPQGTFNVFVRKVSDGKTSVQINSIYKGQSWVGNNYLGWKNCQSTGELERTIFQKLLARLGSS